MISVGVGKWHMRYHAAQPLLAEQVEAWNASLADTDLAAELDALVATDEWVCVRRLKLRVRLSADAGRLQAGEVWRESIAAQLLEVLHAGAADNVVRYRDRRDALADMLYRAAAGDLGRAWAWRQVGLVPAQTSNRMPSSRSVLERAVQHLVADPMWIWPVLTRLLLAERAIGAWTVLVRSLSESDWDDLLGTCPQTRRFHQYARARIGQRNEKAPPLPQTQLTDTFGAWIAAHPWQIRHSLPIMVLLAAAAQLSGEEGASAPSIALIFSAASALVRRQLEVDDRGVRRATRSRDSGETGTRGVDRVDGQRESLGSDSNRNDAAPAPEAIAPVRPTTDQWADAGERDEELPAAPTLPQCEDSIPTDWAGLLYLIHLVPATGLISHVSALESRNEIPEQILQRALWQIAVAHLGAAATDAAVRAFCGGWQPSAADIGEDAAPALGEELEGVAEDAASALRELLATRLRDRSDAGDWTLVDAVCRRPGLIRFEPGWIELRMAAKQADARLRRAALDLDPGWVPWLGCVVRFVYE